MVSKREQIAWAAAATIEERGLEGTSLREVASRTGASLGIVTHHFRNREDLLVATMEVVAEALRSSIESSGDDRLEATLSSVLPLNPRARTQSAVWIAFAGLASRDSAVAQNFGSLYEEWQSAVSEELRSRGIGERATVIASVLTAAADGIALRSLGSQIAAAHQLELLRAAIDQCLCQDTSRGLGT